MAKLQSYRFRYIDFVQHNMYNLHGKISIKTYKLLKVQCVK